MRIAAFVATLVLLLTLALLFGGRDSTASLREAFTHEQILTKTERMHGTEPFGYSELSREDSSVRETRKDRQRALAARLARISRDELKTADAKAFYDEVEQYLLREKRLEACVGAPLPGACYEALLFAFTTVDISREEVERVAREELAALPRPTLLAHREETDLRGAEERVHTALSRAFLTTSFPDAERVPGSHAQYVAEDATYTLPESGSFGEAAFFHEYLPGHHLEATYPQTREPEIVVSYGFREGWATYAETLADELDLYSEAGHDSYLRGRVLRAARALADARLGAGDSEAEARLILTREAGLLREEAATEVARMRRYPGYASSYFIGAREFLRLRAEEEQARGASFSLARFHDAVLRYGAVPFPVIERSLTEAR